MVEPEVLLEFTEDLLYQSTGESCSDLQRTILLASLQGNRITYDQLAQQCGYSARYVKQDIAPKLWQQLSEVLGQKVTKANIKTLIEREYRVQGGQSSGVPQPDSSLLPNPSLPASTIAQNSLGSASPQPVSGVTIERSVRSELTPQLSLYGQEVGTGKGNILLVDDQPKNLKVLSDLLEEQGYVVQQAISGAVALQVINLAPPDLILLDIQMPELDGYTVCQQLKANPATCNIPVIFVSAMDQAWDKVKAFSVGGVDYITKPFKLVEVLARVENQLKLQTLQRQLMQQNLQLQQAIQELQRLAALDPVTQVSSRHRLDDYGQVIWQEGVMNQAPLSLMMVVVTGFGAVNQLYGMKVGDQMLRRIAQYFKRQMGRPEDLVCRYNGLTFAIALPNLDANQAEKTAHSLLQSFTPLTLTPELTDAASLPLGLNIGVATMVPDETRSLEQLLEQCDRALQQAQQVGTNSVVVAQM